MPPNTSLQVVDLQPGSKEYKEVVSRFKQTMKKLSSPVPSAAHGPAAAAGLYSSTVPAHGGALMHGTIVGTAISSSVSGGTYNSIIKIQRIQNLVLYGQYIANKKNMDKKNKPGHQNEMLLYHGTSADTCPKINLQGFNRSFSGKNGKSL